MTTTATKTLIEFDDHTVRQFMIASIFWAIVALLVGVVVATQLAWWQVNFNLPYLTFGRLRPLHTNAAIFAFVGNMMFAGIYYSTQRLVKARTASDLLSHNADPSDEEIRHALEGNYCRCTGYVNIVAAVKHAAGLIREGARAGARA